MTGTYQVKPVLMIALDAAEPRLIEKWMNDGSLPNLKRLYERGAYGRLNSTADWLAGSPWPSFYTGTTPAEHGFYHYVQWRADKMASHRPTPDWLPLRPFWRNMGEKRVIAIDIPLTYQPEPINDLEISGWATHDQLTSPASYPTDLMNWVRREFGPSPLHKEVYGRQKIESLLKLRDDLIHATHCVANLAENLMGREKWDLFLVAFGATHRGGHKLWDISGTEGEINSDCQVEFDQALHAIYMACDTAVGQLVEAAGEEATILVYSLHGMGVNTSRVELLPTILDKILNEDTRTSSTRQKKIGYLQRLRKMVPLEWRHSVKSQLPLALQDKLTTFWRMGGIDWSTTQAVSLVADLQGYIRLNLQGREAAGVIESREAYSQICQKIIEGLHTFVDIDTGKPIVDKVIRSDELFEIGLHRDDLPDLLVRWAFSAAAKHRAIISPRYGTIPWPTPGRNSDGRSGNHRPEGFLLTTGDFIQPKSQIKKAHILDLAPTVYALLDIPKPTEMIGQAIPAIKPELS